MAELLVQDTSLIAVADAIRAKTGGTESLEFPEGFVEAVAEIENSGKSFPDSIVWSESNLYSGTNIRAYDSEHIASRNGYIYTSTDGRTWAEKSTSISELMLVSCKDGVWHGYVSNVGLYYSTDFGATWTLTNLPTDRFSYNIHKTHNIWYCFMSESSDSGMCTFYSLDGKNWTHLIDKMIARVLYADGVYIGTPFGNGYVYRSTDGINFSPIETLASGPSTQVVWHKGRWIAIISNTLYYSVDGGETWSATPENHMYSIYTNGEVIMGLGSDYMTFYRSDDGVTWDPCGITAPYSSARPPSYYNGVWYIFDAKNMFYCSLDGGVSWRQGTLPDAEYAECDYIWCDGLTLFIKAYSSGNYRWKYFYYPLFE